MNRNKQVALIWVLCLFGFAPIWAQPMLTPDQLFGHMIGSDISQYPNFKKEFGYGNVEMGMINIGQNQEIFGVVLESEVGYAFYKGKLCSISYEYKNNDAFDSLSELMGLPRYNNTRNDLLGELYSFAWEGNRVKISCPVFNYGKEGSQFITVEDISQRYYTQSDEF